VLSRIQASHVEAFFMMIFESATTQFSLTISDSTPPWLCALRNPLVTYESNFVDEF